MKSSFASLLLVLVLVLVLVVGCGAESVAITRVQIGTPAARQTSSFRTPGGHRELTPPNVSESLLADEAVLAIATAAETCIDLTLRSTQDHELHDFAPTLIIDGTRYEPTILDERARVSVTPADASPNSCEPGISAPVDAYCIVERSARLCVSRGGSSIRLGLVHPTMARRSLDSERIPYRLGFAWSVR